VNGCYKVVNRKLNWYAAGLECRSLHKDAHLLVINDAQEQLEVAGLLKLASILSTNVGVHCFYFAPDSVILCVLLFIKSINSGTFQ